MADSIQELSQSECSICILSILKEFSLLIHNNDCADTTDIKFFVLLVLLAKYTLRCFLDDLCSTFDFFLCQLNIHCHSDAGKQVK